MKTYSIKIIMLIGTLIFTCITSEAFAKTNNKPNCEFSNYDGGTAFQNVKATISVTFTNEAYAEKNSKFEKLNLLIDEVSNPDCKLQDGRAAIDYVMYGFADAFKNVGSWDLLFQKIQQLKKANPNVAYPILVEAMYWSEYAWVARGKGFASSVTPEGWKLFYERLNNSKSILIQNKEIASTFPAWYELMIRIESDLNSAQEEQDKYFIEGVKRYKSFLPLYIAKRNSLEPKWGGSWEAVDAFINWSVNNANKTEGLSLYSRLYFGVYDKMLKESNFWEDTLVNWPKFKQGFEDLTYLNPKSQHLLNAYASMACEANDKVTYLKIRNKIQNLVTWSWHAKHSVRDCDFMYKYSN